jgi:hypothetical protein
MITISRSTRTESLQRSAGFARYEEFLSRELPRMVQRELELAMERELELIEDRPQSQPGT